MSHDQHDASMPITERFAWKLRKIFVQDENFENYFLQKKEKLLPFVKSENLNQEKSLLSHLPEPWQMKDIYKAANRIIDAISKQEKITIYGDYDVDGTTSCAMLKHFFDDLNYPVDIYIPDRLLEGYGLSSIGVEKCSQNGTKIIITVDNGISAIDGCNKAFEKEIDVIITDHHDIPPHLPNAFAILNPKQNDCLFPYKMLAGVGVAFYLMIAIRSQLRAENKNCDINLKNYLDFVAIGTIADMAPLDGVNHILCKVGLRVLLEHIQNQKRLGLAELLKISGWKEDNQEITSSDVGFKIGPRLNAAGRLGNALRSVEVLCAKKGQEAYELAHFLHSENTDRQVLEKKYVQEAIELAKLCSSKTPHAFILHKEDWHPGVVGLVASRILEKFYRPTLVFGTLDGKLKGSGRSTHSFDLFSVLNEVRDQFISFGGHFHAVGMTLDPSKLPWLCDYLNQKAAELIPENDKIPGLHIDGILSFEDLNVDLLNKLGTLEPYGIENPRPKWLIGPAVVRHIKRIGKDLSQGHAKILLLERKREFWVTAFGMADVFEKLLASGVDVQIVVEAKRHIWNSRLTVDMTIIDFAPVLKIANTSF
jgi:single-stranded-DNA-specific exonuclease